MTDLHTPPVNDGDLFSERARQYALEKPLQRIHILEAGCGWGTGLDLGDRRCHVMGVDMEAPELRAHTCERPDLDTWHLGDLRTAPLPPRAYDLVHASYLIERVPHAELVLDRFVAALKPGGLLLVRLRDRNTAFGYLDRTLPRWLHASGRHAGQRSGDRSGGHRRRRPLRAVSRTGPPPAIYDRVASRSGMRWYCAMRGLVICEEYTSRWAVEARGAGTRLAALLYPLVSALSRGRLTADHSEITLVIRKPENRFARVI
ncbi:hypothetical protein GCM10022254_05520 [Actinomadura meridiana]|uniref:Methyltransferase n=1 Tax=Actinomadura meridiana TaxID=559626 RepID=A0ABP8BSL5_9ACTN